MVRAWVWVITVCLIVGVGLVVVTGGVTANDSITLDITVVDQDGEPVGNAELTVAWDDETRTVTTTSSGVAIVEVAEGADVEIDLEHPDYIRNHPFEIENATVPENETRLTVEMPATLVGNAEITVEDRAGPVADARVWIYDDQDRLVVNERTDDNGVVTTDRIEQGEYTVNVFQRGYLRTQTGIDIDGDVSETVRIERASVDLKFNLTDDYFEPPRAIENVRIEFEDGTVLTTNEDGEARTDVRVNREYSVTIDGEKYRPVTVTVDVEEIDRWFNFSMQREPSLHVETASQRVVLDESILLSVTNEYDEPVAGASVSLDGEEVGQTDTNGQLAIQITESGEREITVSTDGLSDSVTVEGVRPAADDPETPEETPTPTETPTEADDDADDDGTGFGIAVMVAGLIGTTVILLRRRTRT